MKDLLPENHEEICDRIIEKCKHLIDLNYWDAIGKVSLLNWYNNFNDGAAKYLACAILESIIYRSQDAEKAFFTHLLQVHLPQILEDNSIYEIKDISTWMNDISSSDARSNIPIRFTTIESVDHQTAKSGQTLLRNLQRNYFDKSLILSIDRINSSDFQKTAKTIVKAIIIIDDMLCTGEQLETFIKKFNIESSPFFFIYCPLSAIENSYLYLNNKYENIKIHPIEIINNGSNFFNENNEMLTVKSKDGHLKFKKIYLELCKTTNKKINNPLGFGEEELTYLFNNSTPNNNLTLLTYKDEHWKNLAVR